MYILSIIKLRGRTTIDICFPYYINDGWIKGEMDGDLDKYREIDMYLDLFFFNVRILSYS